MRIHFFEEFPSPEHLEKAALLTFPATIFLAAERLDKFDRLAEQLRSINPLCEAAYWPLHQRSYWLSPFAEAADLLELREQLCAHQGEPLKVLFDLELPLLRAHLFLKNLPYFFRNKRMLLEMFEEFDHSSNIRIHTADYPVLFGWMQGLWERLGIAVGWEKFAHSRILMCYSSVLSMSWALKRASQFNAMYAKEWGSRMQVGLGTIATGVFGNERVIPPEELQRELLRCELAQVQEVVIFRLGGLNEDYLRVMDPFVSP